MNAAARDRFIVAAYDAGCPREQTENLLAHGISLQPQQLRAAALARSCDLPDGPTLIGYGGARGGGKSHWGVAQLTDDCTRFRGLTALILRKVGKANTQNFGELRVKVLAHIPHEYSEHRGLLLFENDSKIILGHYQRESDIDAYLGLEYDVILIEEATTLTDTKFKIVRGACRSSKPGWRPRIYTTTNPGGVGHSWYKAMFLDPYRKGRERETRFIPATVDDNKCVNPEYKDTLNSYTGWMLRAYRYGDWDIAAGQFFTNWRAEKDGKPWHVIPAFNIPRNWRMWAALDYGWSHYTFVLLFAQDGDGNVYVVEEYADRKKLPKFHAPNIKAMALRHGRTVSSLYKFVAGDDVFDGPNEDGKTVEDAYQKEGIRLSRGNTDRINGAAEVTTRLGDPDVSPIIVPTMFVFSRCARLIEQIPAMEHDAHRPEDVLKRDVDEEGRGGDDGYDTLKLGLQEAGKRTSAGAAR